MEFKSPERGWGGAGEEGSAPNVAISEKWNATAEPEFQCIFQALGQEEQEEELVPQQPTASTDRKQQPEDG
eukprot:CAMPEP_0184309674 /NCGR_PEP_ID=MMETSP1049-20130417/17754_1 /TAXON_ID=77928 /ORGANISM="Proteomonas sulcata, Strain CCMP704" /LENGTH=70 /DNA_ID=CAMNT_0026622581 /DNA_START=46 /DNA_END=255 /DNA_ORIENTATION=-